MKQPNVILRAKITPKTRSIALMDMFENSATEYDTMLFENAFRIKYDGKYYTISLYVQQLLSYSELIRSSLTFTEFKKNCIGHFYYQDINQDKYEIVNEVFNYFQKSDALPKTNGDTIDIFFERPVQFNAQNSTNRTGYGNEYRFGNCIYEGTKYGETTTYAFVGARCVKGL